MKFTPGMEAAYRRGLEMSRSHQEQQSTVRGRSPVRRLVHHMFGGAAGAPAAFRRPPAELVSEYSSQDEGLAFTAGWIDGAVHNFNLRATIEDNAAPKLAF